VRLCGLSWLHLQDIAARRSLSSFYCMRQEIRRMIFPAFHSCLLLPFLIDSHPWVLAFWCSSNRRTSLRAPTLFMGIFRRQNELDESKVPFTGSKTRDTERRVAILVTLPQRNPVNACDVTRNIAGENEPTRILAVWRRSLTFMVYIIKLL